MYSSPSLLRSATNYNYLFILLIYIHTYIYDMYALRAAIGMVYDYLHIYILINVPSMAITPHKTSAKSAAVYIFIHIYKS